MFGPVLKLLAIYLAVGIAVFAFFNRDAIRGLFGGDRPGTEAASAPPAAVQATPAAPAASPEPVIPAASPATSTSQLAVPTPPASPTYAPVAGQVAATAPSAVPQQSAAAAPVYPQPQPAAPVPALQSPVAPTTAPATQPTASPSFDEAWNAARRSYWKGDVATAVAQYMALLRDQPGDIELNGELGNVLYMEGRGQEAVPYFTAAGNAAVAAGNRPQALQIANILRGLDSTAARALDAQVEAMR